VRVEVVAKSERAKVATKSKRVEVVTKTTHLKQKRKMKGQSENLNDAFPTPQKAQM
jgi:hypothetical protein